MPTPEQIAFFQENKEIIGEMIEKANVKRARTGFDILSEEDVDNAITGMMDLMKAGKDLRFYKFPIPEGQPTKTTPQAKGDVTGERYVFEIIKCSNGFLLNLTSSGQKQTFIFRDDQELSAVFKQTIFKSEERDGKSNGRGKKKPDGGEDSSPGKRVDGS